MRTTKMTLTDTVGWVVLFCIAMAATFVVVAIASTSIREGNAADAERQMWNDKIASVESVKR